jgi:hypothetical protein
MQFIWAVVPPIFMPIKLDNPHFLFCLRLTEGDNLAAGKLILFDKTSKIETWIATSGMPGSQGEGNWALQGRGFLPPIENTNAKQWSVQTKPIDSSGVRGVEGLFYPILPMMVKLTTGNERGCFGIHFDANVPGSAGCVVIRNWKPWEEFKLWMATNNHRDSIPLNTVYI